MLDQIKRLIEERHFAEGLTLKEVQERVGKETTQEKVKAALNEWKAKGDLLYSKKKYYLTKSRPDLFKKEEAAARLSATLEELKRDSPHLYPPTLHGFYQWIAERLPITPSVIQTWIGKSDSKVTMIRHPVRKEAVIIRNEDVNLLISKDFIGRLAHPLLEREKSAGRERYPVTLSQFKKQLITEISKQTAGYKVNAKLIDSHLKDGLQGTWVFLDGATKKICLAEDKPDPEQWLTNDFMRRCAIEILEKRKAEKQFKYPCSEKEFLRELAKAIKLEYPTMIMKDDDVKPYLPRCGEVIEWAPSGRSRKACLPGHTILIKPPTGDPLKKILLEYLELKEGASGSPGKPAPHDPELVNAFWREHERLDAMNLQDRAVPIPKLWRALKGRTTREAFERLLETLHQSGEIQLEHSISLDGLSQDEIDDSYKVGDHILYKARRVK
ncbi:MAG: hypothetical protein JXR73_03915 [Candidatus Omnitrophica bacterium]|nr:hypothetical protein [Candidatus Omnitrophota bacterium]